MGGAQRYPSFSSCGKFRNDARENGFLGLRRDVKCYRKMEKDIQSNLWENTFLNSEASRKFLNSDVSSCYSTGLAAPSVNAYDIVILIAFEGA